MKTEKNIKIRIKSTQTQQPQDLFADERPQEEMSVVEITSEGVLSLDGRRCTVRYDETELTGMQGATTTLAFDEEDRGTVSLTRAGTVTSSLVFCENTRYVSAYDTGLMPIELCVDTKHLENGITADGGSLAVDYLVEICGACAERTHLEIDITVRG